MDERIERLLDAYDERIEAEEPRKSALVAGRDEGVRDTLLLAVGRDTGRLLNALVKGAGATRILELGTSFGIRPSGSPRPPERREAPSSASRRILSSATMRWIS